MTTQGCHYAEVYPNEVGAVPSELIKINVLV